MTLLRHLRVLDLADGPAGFCGRLLADLGAEVVKVERPGGEDFRWIGPLWRSLPDPEESLSFWYHNLNKKGITLDLADPAGQDLFLRLLPHTDVVIEAFPPGTMAGFGLGWETLHAADPRLILASITGFGQTGPRSRFKSCDLVVSAFGGHMFVSGSPSTPPLRAAGEQSLYAASLHGAIGILLALRETSRSGQGTHLDISAQEAVVSSLEHVLVRYVFETAIASRQGARYWNGSFAILPCQDGHILLTPLQHWETVLEWIAGEGMAEDLERDEWQDESYRRQHIDHLLEVLGRWTRTHRVRDLFELAQLMRLPWAPVHSLTDVLRDEQLRARNFFVDVPFPRAGESLAFPGLPYRFSSGSCRPFQPAPRIGEHNRETFQRTLGLSEEELHRLSSLHVI